jgi:hypothetical protein
MCINVSIIVIHVSIIVIHCLYGAYLGDDMALPFPSKLITASSEGSEGSAKMRSGILYMYMS